MTKKSKSRRGLWIGIVGALVIVLALGAGIWRRRAAAARQELSDDQIVTAFLGDLTATASASGQLLAQREATLALGAAGRVESVLVKVGDRVRAGEPLVVLETASLERAVRQAEQTVAIQQANLAELQKGPSAEEIAAAEAALASAQAQLDQLLEAPREAEIAAAEASLRAAQSSLWASAEQRDQVAAGASRAEVAAAQAQLVQAELAQKQAREAHDASMRCFTNYCVTVTWDGGSREICSPNLNIDLPDDLPDLPLEISPVTEKQVCPALGPIEEQTRYNLAAADRTLESAQAALDLLLAGPNEDQLGAANASVSAAAAQRDAAQAQVDLLLLGSTAAQIAAARAQVAQAEATLAGLRTAVSEERLAIAATQIEQARLSLEEARDSLAKATLTAPFDGLVTAVYVEIGEFASGPAVALEDEASLEVVLGVDEVDIGAIVVGQEAVVTLEAWPDRELTGSVVSIAPKATEMLEIVTYQVHLALEAGDLPVRAGMTANAELVTARRENVLLVPNRAIAADRSRAIYTVNRLRDDGSIELVELTIGLRDGQVTEILAGLEPDDRLVVGAYEDVLDFTQGPPRQVRQLR